ncbi:hypothetical protein BDV24DRAFT_14753 [Aspergillus arachidicola]|uniref:Uncharacterized protein n=1 Tax=Aspergillus arachidicola TaxID=656916 RepID=A0A5N6XPB2_9EURO|nr:hypothetical protein BDV24DRAFT_14753 [Aspergillus arachidicola]
MIYTCICMVAHLFVFSLDLRYHLHLWFVSVVLSCACGEEGWLSDGYLCWLCFLSFFFCGIQRCRLASTAPANRSRKWEREGSFIAFLAVHGGLPPHTIYLGTSYGVLRSAYCRLGGYHLWY